MPNVNKDFSQSKFLTQHECDPDILVTLSRCKQEDVSQDNQPQSIKWVLYFKECEKGLVLNKTNAKKIGRILGSPELLDHIGKQVVLWRDEDVEYAGETVGGIRIRAVKKGYIVGTGSQQPSGPNLDHIGDEPPQDDGRHGPQTSDDDLPF